MSTESITTHALPKDLYETIERARIAGGIKGMSVAVMYKGEVVFAKGFGKRNDEDAFTEETLSPIGSLTKAFTSAVIGELVAEKKIDWDTTPVSTYLPEFQLKDPILTEQLTITDLLAHRTSMPDLDDIAWFRVEGSRLDLIKRLRHLDFPTRKLQFSMNYSNFMYLVAGEVAARVEGVEYEELVRSRILEPLGLTNTGFAPWEMAKNENHAIPYTATSYEDAKNGIFERGYLDPVPMADSAAGDLHSNVLDLVRWARVVMKLGELDGKQVLNKESLQETLKGHNFANNTRRTSDFGPVDGYGLGWLMNSYKGQGPMYSHSGNVPGGCAQLVLFPDVDLSIACLSNTDIARLPSQLPYFFADHLLELPKSKDWLFEACPVMTQKGYESKDEYIRGFLPDRIEGKPCLHDPKALVGTFVNPVYGEISIFAKKVKKVSKDSIEMVQGKQDGEDEKVAEEDEEALFVKLRYWEGRLDHYHFDTFRAVLKDFAVVLGTLVTFQTDASGQVNSLLVQLQEDIFKFSRKPEPKADQKEGAKEEDTKEE